MSVDDDTIYNLTAVFVSDSARENTMCHDFITMKVRFHTDFWLTPVACPPSRSHSMRRRLYRLF